ncbi:MAG TPA: hypothetical protein VIG99_07670 [Myxococcaceae bacterium]
MNQRLIVCALAVFAVACGPSFSFRPSNLPATFNFAATDTMLFGSGGCGPRAELDTDTGAVRCFDSGGGGFATPFNAAITSTIVQSDTTPLMVFVGRDITINLGTEVQLRGNRPAVLVALGNMTIAGRITAQNSISKYAGEGGGFSDPTSEPSQGNGPGGGLAVTGAGAGGASYCGVGGKGGNDTATPTTGAAGGPTYGTQDLIPLRGGSSGGKQGNHSGAGGGALQLVASGTLNITADAAINMGGLGGGWFGNGGGSGGAVLIEGDTVTIAGKIAANGGGGGGGAPPGGGDGDNGTADLTAAAGGAGGAGGSPGGAGSAGATIDGAAVASISGQPGGGGGGAGRIRINSRTGAPTLTGQLSPAASTVCTSTGMVTPNP